MAETKARKKAAPRRKKRPEGAPAPAASRPTRWARATPPPAVTRLAEAIEADGGTALATYRDPLGGNWQIFAGLPIDLVEPTPYQRDLSDAHVAKLCSAIDRLGRYLDPMVVVRTEDGHYWTPNGNHRLAAMRTLGARAASPSWCPSPRWPTASCCSTPRRRTTSASARSRSRGWPKGWPRWTTVPSGSSRPSSRRRRS